MPVRQIPLSRRSHVTGAQPLAAGMDMIGHESALERDFVLLQRLDPAVLAIEEQPVKISWAASDGRVRYYTPDYRVVRQDGTELVEVKYRQDLRANWSQYRDRLIAARDWARLHGMSFRIATERGIRTARLLNAKRLVPRMRDPIDHLLQQDCIELLDRGGPLTFRQVVEALTAQGRPEGDVLAALWPMIARRFVTCDLDVPISGGTLLFVQCRNF